MKQGFHCSSCRYYSGLHLGVQDKDDFEAPAQPLLWAFRKALCAFAPLRETRLRGPVSRKGAKAQSSQRAFPEHPNANGCPGAHSYLKASIGSTFVALSAGDRQATSATSVSNAAIVTNVNGSLAVTPNSRLAISRVNRNAATLPSATPARASSIPCPTTSSSTSLTCAPSAILIPISRKRCVIE